MGGCYPRFVSADTLNCTCRVYEDCLAKFSPLPDRHYCELSLVPDYLCGLNRGRWILSQMAPSSVILVGAICCLFGFQQLSRLFQRHEVNQTETFRSVCFRFMLCQVSTFALATWLLFLGSFLAVDNVVIGTGFSRLVFVLLLIIPSTCIVPFLCVAIWSSFFPSLAAEPLLSEPVN